MLIHLCSNENTKKKAAKILINTRILDFRQFQKYVLNVWSKLPLNFFSVSHAPTERMKKTPRNDFIISIGNKKAPSKCNRFSRKLIVSINSRLGKSDLFFVDGIAQLRSRSCLLVIKYGSFLCGKSNRN